MEFNKYMVKKFSVIEFTTAIGCRLDCTYCPQNLFIKRYHELFGNDNTMLKFNDFKKILEKLQDGGSVSFSGMVEPFSNPNCAKMIKYASDNGYKVSLFTTLVGMTMEDIDLISDVKFSSLTLHIPDAEQNSHFDINRGYFKILEAFIDKIPVDYYSCHGTVHPDVEGYIDKNKYVASKMANRAGNLQRDDVPFVDKKSEKKLVCRAGTVLKSYGYTPVILPNGAIILCCMDYGLRHVLGNAITQSVEEIFGGEVFCKVMEGMEKGIPEVLCHMCSSAFSERNNVKLFYVDAIKIGHILNKYSLGLVSDDDLYEIYGEKGSRIIRLLVSKKNKCIYGLGRLFQENYFESSWNDVLNANLFSDGDSTKWDKEVSGVMCISPNHLSEYEDLLIITYVQNDLEIRKDLKDINATFINIYEIFDL